MITCRQESVNKKSPAASSSAVEEYDVGFVPEKSVEAKRKLTTAWGAVK